MIIPTLKGAISLTTGEKIKQLRKQLGMTQEELGAKIGVQKAAINKYETGIVADLKKSTLSSLAHALNVSPIDLLSPDDDLSQDEDFLLTTFRSLPGPGKEYLLQQAQIAKITFGEKPANIAGVSVG